jgi:hypothetical protein
MSNVSFLTIHTPQATGDQLWWKISAKHQFRCIDFKLSELPSPSVVSDRIIKTFWQKTQLHYWLAEKQPWHDPNLFMSQP